MCYNKDIRNLPAHVLLSLKATSQVCPSPYLCREIPVFGRREQSLKAGLIIYSNKDRYSLLSERLLLELRAYWKIDYPRPWLFPGSKANQPMPSGTAQKVYNQARARAGIEQGSGFHTLRHSFATHLFDAGVDPHTLQLLLDHRSIKTTLKYVHVSRRHLMHVRRPLDLLCFEAANLKALME